MYSSLAGPGFLEDSPTSVSYLAVGAVGLHKHIIVSDIFVVAVVLRLGFSV